MFKNYLFFAIFAIFCGFSNAGNEICAPPPSECKCPTIQERESPICASNGYTYYTRCELSCAVSHCNSEVKIVSGGICNPEVVRGRRRCCNRVCPDTWAPVCGSNGKIYGNDCEFKCERDCNPDLSVMSPALIRHYQILKFCK